MSGAQSAMGVLDLMKLIAGLLFVYWIIHVYSKMTRKPSFMEKMILYEAEQLHYQHLEDTEDIPGTYAYDLKKKREESA